MSSSAVNLECFLNLLFPALCHFLWVVLSSLLKHFCYPFSDWLWKVHMVFGLCCDSSTTAWTFDSERRTIWKPELPGSLWADEIHSGVEDREKECAYIHIRMHTTAHTHALQFYVKIWFANWKNCNIVNSKLFVFFIFTAFSRWSSCPTTHWEFLETTGNCEWPFSTDHYANLYTSNFIQSLSVDCVFRPTS